MSLRVAIAVVAAACAVLQGCVTADSLMQRSLERGTAGEEAAAEDLASFAADSGNDYALRCWALRSFSRLERVSPEALNRVGRILTAPGNGSELRSWAAYALGELRRKESVGFYMEAMEGQIDSGTAYYVMEGLAKVVTDLAGDTETAQRVARSMTLFAARAQDEPPEMYDLVSEYVVNLVVLAVTLEQITNPSAAPACSEGQECPAGAAGPAPTYEEVYAAVFRALSHLDSAREKYLAAFERNRMSIEQVLDLAFGAASGPYGPLPALYAWYGGVLGNNPELASACAKRVAGWARDADPRARLLVAWALSRMELYDRFANESAQALVLAVEPDERVLRVLGEMSRNPGKPDKLQQILRVRTRTE